MAGLRPAPFADLVTRLHLEPQRQDALFELPRRRWYLPRPDGPDLSVSFHRCRAGNPLGPAAGPHTQLAQNILLSYVAGGRIIELKTVQHNDALSIPRPCIDIETVGFNVEWSQELTVEQSIEQYVAGMMLIQMFRHLPQLAGGHLDGLAGAFLLDISVGYDLAGIQSEKVARFIDTLRHAQPVIDRLRGQIPREFAAARDVHFPATVAGSVTLSTFHGCPPEEIERICEHLIVRHDLDVVVKLNPTLLGRERIEHLLHEVLGYDELQLPDQQSAELGLDEAVQMVGRLRRLAAQHGRSLGCKLANTLEVRNFRSVFGAENRVMYLSGQPLHVVTMTLAEEFRARVGADVPISFSAGIDRYNVVDAVTCGFVPVSICTDLLRPGGYGRMGWYLQALERRMRELGAADIDELILNHHEQAGQAAQRAGQGADRAATVAQAALLNTAIAAEAARRDPRYRAAANRRTPPRVDSQLALFDCISCTKCISVCPNAANFVYPTPQVSFEYRDVLVAPDGTWTADGQSRRFVLERGWQYACLVDFCNLCGNCDTFCPEQGAPYRIKPNFFCDSADFERAVDRDGFLIAPPDGGPAGGPDAFVLAERPEGGWIRGRLGGRLYTLAYVRQTQQYHFDDSVVSLTLTGFSHEVVAVRPHRTLSEPHRVDMGVYHTLRYLRDGVLDPGHINQINVRFQRPQRPASGTAGWR